MYAIRSYYADVAGPVVVEQSGHRRLGQLPPRLLEPFRLPVHVFHKGFDFLVHRLIAGDDQVVGAGSYNFV